MSDWHNKWLEEHAKVVELTEKVAMLENIISVISEPPVLPEPAPAEPKPKKTTNAKR